jgi:copper chaperone CopZ
MTNQTSSEPSNLCPQCGHKGSKVGRITLESLLKPEPATRISDAQYRFCDSIDCDTVYFADDGTTHSKNDLAVRVGVKEHSSPRHVCYCFDHTIEKINSEVFETGKSTVLDDIKERMKEACWCDTKSPKGTCCLGTVGKYVKIALAENGDDGQNTEKNEPFKDCCSARAHSQSSDNNCEVSESKKQRTGMLAAGGSMLAALAASACCWLPLWLIAFGMSAGGVSAWFEHYRWLFLGITTILLGLGFYFVYLRAPHCAPGTSCAVLSQKMQRFNRSMLWIATVFVIVSASFPKYVGFLLPKDTPITNANDESQIKVATFDIVGMTCEACTVSLRNELVKVPGIVDLAISYQDGTAQISYETTSPPSTEELTEIVSRVGYKAGPIVLEID